jgi:hypothetical protein
MRYVEGVASKQGKSGVGTIGLNVAFLLLGGCGAGNRLQDDANVRGGQLFSGNILLVLQKTLPLQKLLNDT